MSTTYQTLDALSADLTRTFTVSRTQDTLYGSPTMVLDTTSKGEHIFQFTLPNPQNPYYAISVAASQKPGCAIICSLWFGGVELSGYLEAENVIPYIQEILANHVVTVLRYKNQDAYDNRHPLSWRRVFFVKSDGSDTCSNQAGSEELARFLTALRTPLTRLDK